MFFVYNQPIPEDNPDSAMDELDIEDRLKLAKSKLYNDHMKDRLLLQFDELKRDHKTPSAQRVNEADILLEQIQSHFKDMWKDVEEELAFCINMLGHTEEKDKWQFFFSKPIHIKWITEWTSSLGPIISSVLPWFDSHHNWTAMTTNDYLNGANHLVGVEWLFAKFPNTNARLVLEEVTRWKTIVREDACGSFLDKLHLELAAMKLDIAMPNAEAVVTVPESLDVHTARLLLKRKGEKGRRSVDGHRAHEALQAYVNRPLPERVPNTEGGNATRQRKGVPANAPFNVGDEVIISWAKLKEFIYANTCVC